MSLQNEKERNVEIKESFEKEMKEEKTQVTRNVKSRLKEEFIEWSSNSSIHGIPNMFRTEKSSLIRFVWLIFFLLSSIYCCFTLIQSLLEYLEFKVLVNIVVAKDISTEFPVVSLCNLNQRLTNESLDYVQSILVANNLTHLIQNDQFLNQSLNEQLSLAKFLVESSLFSSNYSDEFRRSLDFPLQHMLISCLYGAAPCSTSDFKWYYSPEYGNCYTFNHGEKKRVANRAGKFYGLRLELLVHQPETIMSLSSLSGVHVFINNNSFGTL
jgi:hypothetical protein